MLPDARQYASPASPLGGSPSSRFRAFPFFPAGSARSRPAGAGRAGAGGQPLSLSLHLAARAREPGSGPRGVREAPPSSSGASGRQAVPPRPNGRGAKEPPLLRRPSPPPSSVRRRTSRRPVARRRGWPGPALAAGDRRARRSDRGPRSGRRAGAGADPRGPEPRPRPAPGAGARGGRTVGVAGARAPGALGGLGGHPAGALRPSQGPASAVREVVGLMTGGRGPPSSSSSVRATTLYRNKGVELGGKPERTWG